MKFNFFRRKKRTYFCSIPWTGIPSVQSNLDVTICPCHLNLKIGNLRKNTWPEIWNSRPIQDLRRAFRKGELPAPCRGKLCPVVMGGGKPPG